MKPSKWPDKIEQDLKLGRRVRYVSVVIGFYYNNKTPYYYTPKSPSPGWRSLANTYPRYM